MMNNNDVQKGETKMKEFMVKHPIVTFLIADIIGTTITNVAILAFNKNGNVKNGSVVSRAAEKLSGEKSSD